MIINMKLLVVLGVLVSFGGIVTSQNCTNTEFECNNGKCIPAEYACDDSDDCGDGSDEPPSINPELCPACNVWYDFRCDNGKCIAIEQMCDRDNDCGDGSDEPPAVSPEQCPECEYNGWRCDNGECVGTWFTCDGYENCSDGSDEADDPEECPPCLADTFRCGSGRCIDKWYLCDGKNDCEDRSDEANCTDVRDHVVNKLRNVQVTRLEHQKEDFKKVRKGRKPNKGMKMMKNNPKYWNKMRRPRSTGKNN